MRVGKELIAASATPLVLGILDEGDSHGYAILKRVNGLAAPSLTWTESMLYPLLHRLEQQGYVFSSWRETTGGRRRKVYRLAEAGRDALEEQRNQWGAVAGALTAVGFQGGPPTATSGNGLVTTLDHNAEAVLTATDSSRNRLQRSAVPLSPMPTMAEVAAAAGVSKATVSRALSGSASVASATRSRVIAAVEELGYQPNDLARAFSLGRSSTISAVLPFATAPSAAEVVRGMLDEIRSVAYPLTLLDVGTVGDRDSHIASLTGTRRPTGAIVGMRLTTDEQSALVAAGVPTVLIDHDSPVLSSVRVDNERAGSLAAHHLLSLGHSRIGFVGDEANPHLGFVSSAERLEAFRLALHAAGSAVRLDVALAPHGRSEAREQALAMLAGPGRPTAVFAASDTQALGVLDAARSLGLSVPGDVSILGCDDVALAADLGLSTIDVGLRQLGRAAGDLLLRTLTNPPTHPRRVVIEVSERFRATTARPSGR